MSNKQPYCIFVHSDYLELLRKHIKPLITTNKKYLVHFLSRRNTGIPYGYMDVPIEEDNLMLLKLIIPDIIVLRKGYDTFNAYLSIDQYDQGINLK